MGSEMCIRDRQTSGRVNCNVNVNVKCSLVNTVNANVNVNVNVILEAQTQYIGGKFYYCQQAGDMMRMGVDIDSLHSMT